jgi:hypothetical protein
MIGRGQLFGLQHAQFHELECVEWHMVVYSHRDHLGYGQIFFSLLWCTCIAATDTRVHHGCTILIHLACHVAKPGKRSEDMCPPESLCLGQCTKTY